MPAGLVVVPVVLVLLLAAVRRREHLEKSIPEKDAVRQLKFATHARPRDSGAAHSPTR